MYKHERPFQHIFLQCQRSKIPNQHSSNMQTRGNRFKWMLIFRPTIYNFLSPNWGIGLGLSQKVAGRNAKSFQEGRGGILVVRSHWYNINSNLATAPGLAHPRDPRLRFFAKRFHSKNASGRQVGRWLGVFGRVAGERIFWIQIVAAW